MRGQDFSEIIIVYELFNREYDNALLLKAFFESRGFSVSVLYKLDIVELQYTDTAKLVFVPNCYTEENFDWYYHLLNGRNYYLIDLQYEQVLSNNTSNIEFHIPKGKAAQVVHLCWGEQYRNILLKHGISPDKAYVSGALHLDFLTPQFQSFWESREKLSRQHTIDNTKSWNLYISSFSTADNELSKAGIAADLGDEYAEYFADISSKSRKKTIEWFRGALVRDDNNIFIYRKHPAELLCEELKELEEQFPNKFYILDSYNIKQWIIVCDRILTWYSTSIAECYAAKKSFYILRPMLISHQYEVQMYDGGHFIENLDEFLSILDVGEIKSYPIDTGLIDAAYQLNGELAVVRIARLIDRGLCYDYFETEQVFKKKRKQLVREGRILLKQRIKKIYKWLYLKGVFRITSQSLRSKYAVDEWERVLPIDEIRKKTERLNVLIGRVLEGENDV